LPHHLSSAGTGLVRRQDPSANRGSWGGYERSPGIKEGILDTRRMVIVGGGW
jgi:hypothetical protein